VDALTGGILNAEEAGSVDLAVRGGRAQEHDPAGPPVKPPGAGPSVGAAAHGYRDAPADSLGACKGHVGDEGLGGPFQPRIGEKP